MGDRCLISAESVGDLKRWLVSERKAKLWTNDLEPTQIRALLS